MTSSSSEEPGTAVGLGATLRDLRTSAHPVVSQTAAAGHIGVSQAKLSRAERGQFLLDPPSVRALAALYGATPDVCDRLAGWAEALEPARLDSRLIFQRGTNHFQERLRRVEEGSALVRSFQPGMVIGPLQTETYARTVMGQSGAATAADAVRVRLARGRMMLDDPGRQWVLIHTEGALRWRMASAEAMVEQMAHIIACSRQPNIRIGVIPYETAVDFAAPHGFHLYDQQAVMIGTKTATALSSDERDVRVYHDLFDRLEGAAAWDDDARAVLVRISDDCAR